jgi:[acyl-carrier-protein] S-malonyltransferase
MFDLVVDCAAAEPVFAAASEQLGADPRRLVQDGGAVLFEDRIGQILCCTQALAVWAALGGARPARAVIAGYSVGELAAWGCAGAFDARTILRLAKRRAEVMDEAAPKNCGLAGIVGLQRPVLEPILTRHATSIAIINDVDSFVVGGHVDSLAATCQDAATRGATRTVMLRVSVPSHTVLLARAMPAFRAALHEAAPHALAPRYRLLSGIDGDAVFDLEAGCDKLARQIATPIHWAACLTACRAAGAETALELGPGAALSHMAARVFPQGRARAAQDFRSLPGLQAWLARGSS